MEFFQSLCTQLISLNFKAIFWVVVFFGGSIFVHELGHFIAAKKRKLFIARFSIGFGPRLFVKNIQGTEFCISLFPLGGYVALPQLMQIKELEGKYEIPPNLPPVSCADKIIVSSMGVIFNIIFAFILATILWGTGMEQPQSITNNIIGYVNSEITLPNGEKVPCPAREAGLQIGDQIIAIDGSETHNFIDIMHAIALGKNRDQRGPLSTITILRDGQRHNLTVHPILIEQNRRAKDSFRVIGIETYQELSIAKIYENTPAQRAGLQKGDKIIAINGEKLFSHSQFNDILEREADLQLLIDRDKKMMNIPVHKEKFLATYPFLRITTTQGVFEVMPNFINKNFVQNPCEDACTLQLLTLTPEAQELFPEWSMSDTITRLQGRVIHNIANAFSVLQKAMESDASIALTVCQKEFFCTIEKVELIPPKPRSSFGVELDETHVLVHKNPFQQIRETTHLTFLTLGSLISPSSDIHLKNLSGPPGILDALHTFAARDFRLLLWFVIVLNVNLAIINLLPLPILDGGVIVLTLLEKIFRRKVAAQILMHTQLAFVILILGIMIYVSFFDINKILARQNAEQDYSKQRRLIIGEQLLWNGLNPFIFRRN
jgi:RIP metalloprotease RseP